MTGPVKRFVVFAFDNYYPGGGWNDVAGSYDTLDEARAAAPKNSDRAEIIDLQTGEEVDAWSFARERWEKQSL